jgi:hypothetical protein
VICTGDFSAAMAKLTVNKNVSENKSRPITQRLRRGIGRIYADRNQSSQ